MTPSVQVRSPAGQARRPTARALAAGAAGTAAQPAWANPLGLLDADLLPNLMWFDPKTAVGLAILTGLVIFSTTLAILHIRERSGWAARERTLLGEIDGLRDATDRADLLLGAERQVIVSWAGRDAEPAIEGDPFILVESGNPHRLLAFGSWLAPSDSGQLEGAVDRLRERGESFRLVLRSLAGAFVDAEGRAVAGRALMRLRNVSGFRADLIRQEGETAEAREQLRAVRAVLNAIDQPVWLRGPDGRLRFVNRAYCRAVEASDPDDATGRSLELLERADREQSVRERGAGATFRARVAAIMAGSRRVLDILEAPVPGGSGGIAQDVSEVDALRSDLNRQGQANVRTLDQLSTAVAMFDASGRLAFHNAAYRQLWGLDIPFLAAAPTDSEILDRLRTARRLPEQADYRVWKAGILDAYRSVEPRETWWHLPDRRTLRVVANPNPQGGLTYLFDDVSDRLGLESRYNALIRTQGETLNSLAEGVALFGQDGRLRLFNRAFAEGWRLDTGALDREPHVDAVVALCRPLAPADDGWAELRSAVSGLTDVRLRVATRLERRDGTVLDCAAEPLPDGATLLTFVDVTASVNVERALTDRNDALELASRVRNDFVHHVSYELRSPLQSVIGFAEFLGAETVGPLNERQREYAGLITRSSNALLAIIDDILDLASIDADTIELAREPVDIRATIDAAARGIMDRLAEARLKLAVDVPADIGFFAGDPQRIRQVVFNLLSNAAAFSSSGQTIAVAARRRDGEVVLRVADQGAGIPPAEQGRVFERFESGRDGKGRRGVGLGLSIVRSFVELHGGRVELVSAAGAGTTVTCYFPADGHRNQQDAAA